MVMAQLGAGRRPPQSTSFRPVLAAPRAGLGYKGRMNKLAVLGFLILATTLEASGDAVVRLGLGPNALAARVGLFALGAAMLFGYGLFLNLAPVEFEKGVGLYIATLFVVWQVVNYVFYRHVPGLPILAGGALIVAGGCIVTFWEAKAAA